MYTANRRFGLGRQGATATRESCFRVNRARANFGTGFPARWARQLGETLVNLSLVRATTFVAFAAFFLGAEAKAQPQTVEKLKAQVESKERALGPDQCRTQRY